MGVDSSKLPKREEWLNRLLAEHTKPVERKKFFYVIWLLNSEPVGHSNINKISFGDEAYMHLHLWHADRRKKGMGFELMKKSIPYYFDRFQLKRLYCEPSAFNEAPNSTLRKLGFKFIKQYNTTPGWINLFQTVNSWYLDLKMYEAIWK
jgi:RimJ/RimL family protein N-acetyltransferase